MIRARVPGRDSITCQALVCRRVRRDGRLRSRFDGELKWKGGRYGHGQVLLASGHLVITAEVGTDLLVSNARVIVEGEDAVGYRVQVRAAGESQNFYVVREDGALRLLTASPMLGPVALMALESLEAGDAAAAQRWLNWARTDLRAVNSEDPLEGPAFARAWTVSASARVRTM